MAFGPLTYEHFFNALLGIALRVGREVRCQTAHAASCLWSQRYCG